MRAGMRIVELQGVLFFGSATRLVDGLGAVLAEAAAPRWLLLDFQRVPALDSSAAQVLLKLDKAARRAGAQLHCSGLSVDNTRALRAAGFAHAVAQLHADIDDAVRAWDDTGQHWLRLQYSGAGQGMEVGPNEGERFDAPWDFKHAVQTVLRPGSIILVTPQSLQAGSTGSALTVIANDEGKR